MARTFTIAVVAGAAVVAYVAVLGFGLWPF